MQTNISLWERFQKYSTSYPALGLSLDLSRMNFPADFLERMAGPMAKSFAAMADLEKGAIANPDEKRMVGHYWLRNAELAPDEKLRNAIQSTLASIKDFAQSIHYDNVKGGAGYFETFLIIGIGGSALGPQFVTNALSNPATDKMRPFFFDNTDPDGMDKVLATIGDGLPRTLCIVISKSGGTK